VALDAGGVLFGGGRAGSRACRRAFWGTLGHRVDIGYEQAVYEYIVEEVASGE
jgi:hypothetical protein